MMFSSENSDPPSQPSPEDKIQRKFAEVQPEVSSPVDLDKAVEEKFNSDLGTEKIRRVFYEEIDKGKFAIKVQDIVIKARKIKTYDNVESLIAKYAEKVTIFIIGGLFFTYIWPLLKSFFNTTPTP